MPQIVLKYLTTDPSIIVQGEPIVDMSTGLLYIGKNQLDPSTPYIYPDKTKFTGTNLSWNASTGLLDATGGGSVAYDYINGGEDFTTPEYDKVRASRNWIDVETDTINGGNY